MKLEEAKKKLNYHKQVLIVADETGTKNDLVEAIETVLQALDNSISKEKAEKKMETLKVAKERNIKKDFDTVYKDGYYTGGIDAIYELLEG